MIIRRKGLKETNEKEGSYNVEKGYLPYLIYRTDECALEIPRVTKVYCAVAKMVASTVVGALIEYNPFPMNGSTRKMPNERLVVLDVAVPWFARGPKVE